MAKKTGPPAPKKAGTALELRVQELEEYVEYLAENFQKAITALNKVPCTCDDPPRCCRLESFLSSKRKKKKA